MRIFLHKTARVRNLGLGRQIFQDRKDCAYNMLIKFKNEWRYRNWICDLRFSVCLILYHSFKRGKRGLFLTLKLRFYWFKQNNKIGPNSNSKTCGIKWKKTFNWNLRIVACQPLRRNQIPRFSKNKQAYLKSCSGPILDRIVNWAVKIPRNSKNF